MPKKPLTIAQRREQLVSALERVAFCAREEGYILGCRAANPTKHDTKEMRDKESLRMVERLGAQMEAVRAFNSALQTQRARIKREATP